MKKYTGISLLVISIIFICTIFSTKAFVPFIDQSSSRPFGRVEISFHFERQSLQESNQYAVWIQNQKGEVVKTLFVTRYTAEGGYGRHLNSLPRWKNRADAPHLSANEIDGFSGATPQSGWQEYTWDGTDRNGRQVPFGRYVFIVESSYNDENRIIFMGLIPTGGQETTVRAKPSYYPNQDDEYEIFGAGMIEEVEARYIPAQ